MSQTPQTEGEETNTAGVPSGEQTTACGTSTNCALKSARLRKQPKEAVRRRHQTGTGSGSTSAPMRKTTQASGQPSGGAKAALKAVVGPACGELSATAVASRRRLRQQATGTPRNDDSWMVAGSEVAQWVNKLDVMEEKIKQREVNLKRMRAHLAAAGRCMVDFTNPVEWHEQMIAELPWPVRHGRALSDRQVAVNVEAQTLTQRLMAVTQQAVKSEAIMRQLEAERSALFASVESRCLDKLESILVEYSACLTFAPTRWALVRELVRTDGITPALARVNHRLEGTGLRLDFHFAPTRPSAGRPSSSRPSTTEHWWVVPEVETPTITISSDSDSDSDVEKTLTCRCDPCRKEIAAAAAQKVSTSAPAAATTTTTTTATPEVVVSAVAAKGAARGTKRKTDQ